MSQALEAAREFYRRIQSGDAGARARLTEIIGLAQQGDPQALRAVRLLRAVMTGQVRVGADLPPERVAYLRALIAQAG